MNAVGLTPGDLAELCGVRVSKIVYLLNNRPIEPMGRCGTIRLYPPSTVERLRAELADIQRRRTPCLAS